MKKKRPSIRKQYKESLYYLKDSLNYIYFTIGLFIIAGVLGFFFRAHLTFIDAILEELFLKTEGLGPGQLILFILQNNFQSSLFALVLGLFVGVFPLLSTITNGALIGYVLGKVYEVSGFAEWWRLLPHGIFELPAIFISISLGLKLGHGVLKNYLSHYWNKSKSLTLLPLILGIILSVLSIPALRTVSEELPTGLPENLFPLAIIQILIVLTAFFYVIFIASTMIADKKMRKEQKKFLKHDFSNSIVTFFLIVFPLLIIAAIIEGLLIAFIS